MSDKPEKSLLERLTAVCDAALLVIFCRGVNICVYFCLFRAFGSRHDFR